MLSPGNMYTSKIMQTEQATFKNMHTYACKTTNKKKDINSNRNKKGYMGELGGRNGKLEKILL